MEENSQINENKQEINAKSNSNVTIGVVLKCAACDSILKVTDKFCPNCGTKINQEDMINNNQEIKNIKKNVASLNKIKNVYLLDEKKMLEIIINKELEKIGVIINSKMPPNELIQNEIDDLSKMLPKDIHKRKKILNTIFSILVSIYITLIFFHFPIYTYILGFIILLTFFIITRKFNFNKYLKKQLEARPKEKISNIIMNEKNNLVQDNSLKLFIPTLIISIILPLIIFSSPHILYEKTEGGYAVRYYTFGLTNFKTATIPETYKNEKVISLRGNTFSNMLFLESVNLSDNIIEIRGQAFKNCIKLVNVNIPKNLEYLGGGAFYNAYSIKNIELPDTLTFLGGEVFFGAESLENVKLSNNLNEIRGDSFEYCTSLRSITIPDSVERIGAHAFYGDYSLSKVVFTENSKLTEIGSSAFRECLKLESIVIPDNTYINERAFKESPTTIERYSDYNNKNKYQKSEKITLYSPNDIGILKEDIVPGYDVKLVSLDNFYDKVELIVNGENVLVSYEKGYNGKNFYLELESYFHAVSYDRASEYIVIELILRYN